ncbi:MAG: PRC-barrel domain-containing protein [Bacteroidales bacterium]|nr:PRC-barrel domain-containing protein [Bacteroidales bacterium]
MAYNSDILLGRITKVSGYEGAVTVKLERFFSGEIPYMESVFLEIEGRPVPFFIADSEYSGADILKLIFEGYNSSDKVIEFVGCRVFLTASSNAGNRIEEPGNLTGYTVLTSGKIILGTVEEVIQNPGQWLLSVISSSKKAILIPLHEDLIVKIDNRKKILIMEIPEGLTEIN